MANKTIDMQKIQVILRLYQSGYSVRAIGRQTGVHRSIIKRYLDCVGRSGLTTEEALQLNPGSLSELVYKNKEQIPSGERQRDFDTFSQYAIIELPRKHVTLQLLHKEYLIKYANGYQYSQFCSLLSRLTKRADISMVQKFAPGELMQLDFTGDKMYWVDIQTGEQQSAEVLVITLAYSGLTFVQALRSQQQEEFISGFNKGVHFFGGVTQRVLLDNFKSGVIKADRYEPNFNKLLLLFCEHYGIIPDATRVRKPRDKAQVESHVNIIYKRIFGPLRDRIFNSVADINEAIIPLLQEHNNRPYRGSNKSRMDFFNENEREVLIPLAEKPFAYKHYKKATVQKNYHIWLGEDQHYYSVPFANVGKCVEVVYDEQVVEIFFELQRIALHQRSYKMGRYTTLDTHMPERHLKVKQGMDADFLIEQAAKIGTSTKLFVEKLLARGVHCQPNFKSCQGILSLAKKYTAQRLEQATQRALQYNNITYKAVQSILIQSLDCLPAQTGKQISLPFNENTRGAKNYQ